MAKFTTLESTEVLIGKQRLRAAKLAPYLAALDGEHVIAGKVELEKDERPERVRDLLRAAARIHRKRIRSSYVDGERVIYWKLVGA